MATETSHRHEPVAIIAIHFDRKIFKPFVLYLVRLVSTRRGTRLMIWKGEYCRARNEVYASSLMFNLDIWI